MAAGVSPARERRAGILLHPTSLPGPYGIGDIGPEARRFLDWLEAAGQRIWQMLPLNPTDGTGSPYASPSAFARNPLLLSIDDLVADGWLTHAEKPFGAGSPYRVDFADVAHAKGAALHLAAERVAAQIDLGRWAARHDWVETWAEFAALVRAHGHDWRAWPEALAARDGRALAAFRDEHAPEISRHLAKQWMFERQFTRLRAEAESRGISLWGDVPFFVNGDSCDVWAWRELFRLDDAGLPTVTTGCPPDAFAPDGQGWGTPHYDLAAHATTGYAWWCDRLAVLLELFHEVRLDHFRGFAGVWEIPSGALPTQGRWIPSFGAPLLEALRQRLGGLPLIAEDLGIITPDVEALLAQFELPGMVILQFAFSDALLPGTHKYLPHNHRYEQVVYPGTHDNPTAHGWYDAADEPTRDHFRRYLSCDGRAVAGDMVRAAYRSVCKDAVVQLQDVLGLGGDARMNTPGTIEGNWSWRAGPEAFGVEVARWLAAEARLTGR